MKFSSGLLCLCMTAFLLSVLSSCSKSDYAETPYQETMIGDTDFEVIEVLKAEQVDQINKHLLHPQFIHQSDSLLLIAESGVSEDIFKLFSLADFSFLGGFGRRGEGPGEFSRIISEIVQTRDMPRSGNIMVYDWGQKIISELDLEESLSDGVSPATKNSYQLPSELMLAQRVTFVDDTTVVAMGESTEGMLAYVDTETDHISYVPFIPKISEEQELTPQEIRELYLGEFAVDKQGNRIVLAMNRFPEIIILDLEGNIQQVIRFPLEEYPADQPEDLRTFFYRDVKVTGNYIYGVYLGLSYEEMGEIHENYPDNDAFYSTEIHVFDWEGRPVRKLVLEDKFIPFIQVDSAGNRIFGLDAFSDQTPLLVFESGIIE